MTTLADVARLLTRSRGLCVVSTTRADGTVQASLVNAGVLARPGPDEEVVGFVVRADARKLANLRARPQVTVTVHDAWEWATVEGRAQLVGPDDSGDADALRALLRAVYTAAGGSHDDWDEFDRVMSAERRTAVLVTPTRVYSNG